MSLGEQKANLLEQIGIEFHNSIPKPSKKSHSKSLKIFCLKEICKKHNVNFEKVHKIFLSE